MRRAAWLVAVAVAPVVAGCGKVTPPDDMLVLRTGSIPGAKLSLRVTDAGFASCNRKPLVMISGHDLIETRAAVAAVEGEAKAKRRLPALPGSVFQYRVRIQQGTIGFADNSRGKSSSDAEIAYLTHLIATGPCHLRQ